MWTKSVLFSVLVCFQYSLAQIAVVEIRVENLLKMQQGLGWPRNLTVTEGHEALLSLGRTLEGQEACTVTTPSGLTFNVNNSPDSLKYQQWSEGCGIRVRNIVRSDEGRWRLTASRGEESIVGWTEVVVHAASTAYTPSEIALQDGDTHTHLSLTTLENSYCVVAQPFSESSLVPGHCSVTLDRTTRAVQGNWNILLGIPGKVEELEVNRHVVVQAERLDVGYVHDTAANKIHLYCNIQHSTKNITFCRFQRTSMTVGFNVVDGLSDGSHSYYGDGFLHKHCGMTIESPEAHDYTTWRCSVGVKMWVDNHLVEQTPMQALISVASSTYNDFLRTRIEPRAVFVEDNRSFTIMCRAAVSLTYCWFQHPNGTQYTPVHLSSEEQQFWYTGEGLTTGDCGITFSHALTDEEGLWVCHMGPRDTGLELTDTVEVRVTGPLAANEKVVSANVGDTVTLYCRTANGHRPLDYCRFLSPSYFGLSIDETIKEENAIQGRYYFTPGRNSDFGDCSLTIKYVEADDFGDWTCGALINEEIVEARDTVTLRRESSTLIGQAGIIGMSVGLAILVVLLVGILIYQRRRRTSNPPAPPSRADSGANIVPMDVGNNQSIGRPSITSNMSSGSSTDNESVILNVSRRASIPSVLNQDRPSVRSVPLSSQLRVRPSTASSLGRTVDIPLSTIERPRPRSAASVAMSHSMSVM